jgi:hypothetical protein
LRCCKAAQHEEGCCEPHLESVVILCVVEQEYAGRRRFLDRGLLMEQGSVGKNSKC